jgi:hypothetical protein
MLPRCDWRHTLPDIIFPKKILHNHSLFANQEKETGLGVVWLFLNLARLRRGGLWWNNFITNLWRIISWSIHPSPSTHPHGIKRTSWVKTKPPSEPPYLTFRNLPLQWRSSRSPWTPFMRDRYSSSTTFLVLFLCGPACAKTFVLHKPNP